MAMCHSSWDEYPPINWDERIIDFYQQHHNDIKFWGGPEAGTGGWRYRCPDGTLTERKPFRGCVREAMQIAAAEEL